VFAIKTNIFVPRYPIGIVTVSQYSLFNTHYFIVFDRNETTLMISFCLTNPQNNTITKGSRFRHEMKTLKSSNKFHNRFGDQTSPRDMLLLDSSTTELPA
jgi:hypothetical protein